MLLRQMNCAISPDAYYYVIKDLNGFVISSQILDFGLACMADYEMTGYVATRR